MRYVFSEDNKQHSYFITKSERLSSGIRVFWLEDEKKTKTTKVYIRQLAQEIFLSKDGIQWKKTTSLPLSSPMIWNHKTLEIFRGFIPSGKQKQTGGILKTQMPGKVVKVLVQEGDVVKAGDPLLILEAMKMENEFKSSGSGIVRKIYVQEGMALEAGFLMMELEETL